MPKLIYANSKNSDMFYLVKMNIPDAFLYLDTGKEKLVFLDHREIGVFEEKNKSKDIKAVLLNSITDEIREDDKGETMTQRLILKVIKKYALEEVEIGVPISLPLDIADFLRSVGIKLKVLSSFCSERIVKNKNEVEKIKDSIKATYKAFENIEKILSESEVEGKFVKYQGKVLTSEFLKYETEKILLKNDMVCSESLIISSGEQTVMPHHTGDGAIKANVPIICDLFPKNRKTGYFSDMTRTYVVGQASERFKEMYGAVLKAQLAVIEAVRPGLTGRDIHNICVQVFLGLGFDVGGKGFVHGTGHGIGVDIHENPYINAGSEHVLAVGNVFTVEPGLYYSGIGGVRIEDDILVTEKGYENLVDYDKKLIEFK